MIFEERRCPPIGDFRIFVDRVNKPTVCKIISAIVLEHIDPSPLHILNRAVAVAECKGPEVALKLLEGLVPPSWLDGHYLWAAVLADLHRRAGHVEQASQYRDQALAAAPTDKVRDVLQRRLLPPRKKGNGVRY